MLAWDVILWANCFFFSWCLACRISKVLLGLMVMPCQRNTNRSFLSKFAICQPYTSSSTTNISWKYYRSISALYIWKLGYLFRLFIHLEVRLLFQIASFIYCFTIPALHNLSFCLAFKFNFFILLVQCLNSPFLMKLKMIALSLLCRRVPLPGHPPPS